MAYAYIVEKQELYYVQYIDNYLSKFVKKYVKILNQHVFVDISAAPIKKWYCFESSGFRSKINSHWLTMG